MGAMVIRCKGSRLLKSKVEILLIESSITKKQIVTAWVLEDQCDNGYHMREHPK